MKSNETPFWRGRLLAEGSARELAERAGVADLEAAYGHIVREATAEETDGRAA